MPAEDGLRRNEERSPAFPGYETGAHADQRSIGPGEPGTGNLAAKHGQLVGSRHPLPQHPTRGPERPRERAGTNGRARTGPPGEPRRASFDWSKPGWGVSGPFRPSHERRPPTQPGFPDGVRHPHQFPCPYRRVAMNKSTANWIGSTYQCRCCYERVSHIEAGMLCTQCYQLRRPFPTGESNRRRRGHAFLTKAMVQSLPRRQGPDPPRHDQAVRSTCGRRHGVTLTSRPPSAAVFDRRALLDSVSVHTSPAVGIPPLTGYTLLRAPHRPSA